MGNLLEVVGVLGDGGLDELQGVAVLFLGRQEQSQEV